MLKKFRSCILALIAMILAMSGIMNAQADLQKIKEKLPKLLGATNQGTEFVLAFHPAWESPYMNNRIRIYVSSNVATSVRLTIPYFDSKPLYVQTTKPNDIIEFVLEANVAQPYTRGDGGFASTLKHTQVWQGRGIIIESDDPIVVYGVTRYYYTSDGFLAIPTFALGKQYTASSYIESADYVNQSLTPYVSIVGVYNNTSVRFYLGGNNQSRIIDGDHGNKEIRTGQSISATLNRGDDWLIAAKAAGSELVVSLIITNKRIAVISVIHCAYVPVGNAYCDFLIEQEYPMNAWGRKYHVTPIVDRKYSAEIRLFAKEANTRFYRDYNTDSNQAFFVNTASWGIEGLAWKSMRPSIDTVVGMVVTANKPIEIVQYNTGSEEDGTDSDPFQMMLVPEEQFLNEIIFNTPGIKGGLGFWYNYINIVYKSDSTGQIPDDLFLGDVDPYMGTTNWKKVKDWNTDPGVQLFDPDYRNSKIKVFSKTVRLSHDAVWRLKCQSQKITAYSYGFADDDSYGYPTGMAIKNLEILDTVKPVPFYKLYCDGSTDTVPSISGKDYPFVRDMPDDATIRSNMALILFDKYNSTNYSFEMEKGWIPGDTRDVRWKVKILDPSQDGEAIITFSDRAGNDTTIIISYTAVKLSMSPRNFYFGNVKVGEKKTQEFTVRNDSKRKVTLQELSLKTMRENLADQGFTLDIPFDLNDSLEVGETRTFNVTFEGKKAGEYKDSIGTGDNCFYQYKAIVRASVGTPIINVSDIDFGQRTIGIEGTPMIATIQNTGSSSLAITGYTGPSLSVYRTDLGDLNISPDNPLIIDVNETVNFKVWFKPDAEQTYLDTIVFISDAGTVIDPLCLIRGVGIKPQLQATGENWGPKRAHLTKYDTYTYETFDYPYPSPTGAIVLSNPGTKSVSISQINVLENTQGDAFEIDVNGVKQPLINYVSLIGSIKDDQGRTINTIPSGETRHIPVYFHPRTPGSYKLVIEYVSDAEVKPTSTLEGIGIYPQITTEDVDFGVHVIGDVPIVKTVRFTNEQWDYQDALTLQGFNINPSGSISPVLSTPGTEGFSYDEPNIIDRTGNAITFPYKILPGEYVEITGNFSAQRAGNALANLISISDASIDATSQWKGFGIHEDLQLAPGAEPYICYNTSNEIVVTLSNNGTSAVVIPSNSISIINDTKGYFSIERVLNGVNAEIDLTQDYNFAPGEKLTIVVLYKPVNWTGTNNQEQASAEVQVITNSITPIYKIMSIGVSGSAIHYQRTTYSKINGQTQEIVEPGQSVGQGYSADPIIYSIYVKDGRNLDLTGPTQFTIKFRFAKNFLAIKEDGNKNPLIRAGADLAGWKVDNVSRKIDKATNTEEVTVSISGATPFQSGASSEILRVEFLAFLP